MHIDESLVGKLAGLARIEVTADERRLFAGQLPKIVEYVGQLQSVAADIVPMVEPSSPRLRTDEVSSSQRVEAILNGAPERIDHFWKVPAVF